MHQWLTSNCSTVRKSARLKKHRPLSNSPGSHEKNQALCLVFFRPACPRYNNRGLRTGEPVISHVFVGVNQFDAAFAFYGALMEELGLRLKFCEPAKPWAAWTDGHAPR